MIEGRSLNSKHSALPRLGEQVGACASKKGTTSSKSMETGLTEAGSLNYKLPVSTSFGEQGGTSATKKGATSSKSMEAGTIDSKQNEDDTAQNWNGGISTPTAANPGTAHWYGGNSA